MTKKRRMVSLRTQAEENAAMGLAEAFARSSDCLESRLANFPKYIRRQNLTRLLVLYELFKMVLEVKGSIVECGVHQGFGLMTWAKLSAVLEPVDLTRRIYGFDTFAGFPGINDYDRASAGEEVARVGELRADSYEELTRLIALYDQDRYLGHIPKVRLIGGDATETIPRFVAENPHLVVSLLFLDFDLYEPTRVALEWFIPRMPQGAIVAFDELDNPRWPGETSALQDVLGIKTYEFKRLTFDPYVAYARVV